MAELNCMQRARMNGYRAGTRRRASLVDDARVERRLHEDERRQLAGRHRQLLRQQTQEQIVNLLDDEAVEVVWESDSHPVGFYGIFTCRQPLTNLSDLLVALQASGITLNHMETRAADKDTAPEEFSLLLRCVSDKPAFLSFLTRITAGKKILKLQIHKDDKTADVPWFPESIDQLDRCGQVVTKYEPKVDPRHPGFGDESYIKRRMEITQLGQSYRHGEPIPKVDYTAEELETWRQVYNKLRSLYASSACVEFTRNLALLEKECGYSAECIPQLQDVSGFLQRKTGFRLRPCGGLLSARDFLASLAFRVFQATQYVRHASCPHHSPEPDVIHELLGHAPMFADETFAQFSQELGLASLGASDADIERLATVYWWVVEFGLCKENGQLRACGAGLLSAFGELEHALSDTPEKLPFVPAETAVQKYNDDDYQQQYVVAESIADAMDKLRAFARDIERPFAVVYEPYTQSVRRVDVAPDLGRQASRLHADAAALAAALQRCAL